MKVLIPLAGHSRRFKEAGYKTPKAFIEINGKPMISYVVEMFSPKDTFYFIMNEEQYAEDKNYEKILKSLASRANIVVIPKHELGPVHSCLQVKDLLSSPDEEVIVSYCDFFVDWDYDKFLRHARNHDAAISTFRGFHPASMGDTYYAYIRCDGNKMLELREKRSFTPDRTKEFASTGTYYFKTASNFLHYAKLTMSKLPELVLKEAYVSLLYNFMVQDGQDIIVHDVDRFICLGTPSDLEQYLFWSKAFLESRSPIHKNIYNHQINLIPMAGKGTRFKESGYRVTKPLIQVDGKPMAVTACETFPPADKWVYLVRDTELQKHPIEKALFNFNASSSVISVDHDTSGQAATCLLAEKELSQDLPCFIASCDYQSPYSEEKWAKILNDKSIDAAVWTTKLKGTLYKNPNAFAYCVTEQGTNKITKIVEKKTISTNPELDPMVVGSFWFRRSSDFLYAAKELMKRNITVNGEHYVGTSLNLLIEKGLNLVTFDVDQWISFGDPFELQVYEYWQDHFAFRKKQNA